MYDEYIESFAKYRFMDQIFMSPNVTPNKSRIKIAFKGKRNIVFYSTEGLLEEISFTKDGGICELIQSIEYFLLI